MPYTLQIVPFCARTSLFLAIAIALYLVSRSKLWLSTAAEITEMQTADCQTTYIKLYPAMSLIYV